VFPTMGCWTGKWWGKKKREQKPRWKGHGNFDAGGYSRDTRTGDELVRGGMVRGWAKPREAVRREKNLEGDYELNNNQQITCRQVRGWEEVPWDPTRGGKHSNSPGALTRATRASLELKREEITMRNGNRFCPNSLNTPMVECGLVQWEYVKGGTQGVGGTVGVLEKREGHERSLKEEIRGRECKKRKKGTRQLKKGGEGGRNNACASWSDCNNRPGLQAGCERLKQTLQMGGTA